MNPLRSAWRRLDAGTSSVAAAALASYVRRPASRRRHGLPAPLIVSLTSYPPRFAGLYLTLRCLLSQTVQPDHVVLWLAEDDLKLLPPRITGLTRHGLLIRTCPDIRSYKKLVPALRQWPDAYILTADDDVYYPANWIERFVVRATATEVLALRARRVPAGGIAAQPYVNWTKLVTESVGFDILPLGVHGVLYPPHSLDQRVFDVDTFMRLSPTADDLYFYWMARLRGTPVRFLGHRIKIIEWLENRSGPTLSRTNKPGGNDRQIKALAEAFPLP